MTEQVRSDFAQQYTWSRKLGPGEGIGSPPKGMVPLPVEKAQVFQYLPELELAKYLKKVGRRDDTKPKTAAVSSKLKASQEWYIDVVVER